ncbi:Putative enzyme of poly-gamma-glutamate biosynthesis (capsule formation)-like protein (plasmid) [Novosphingobium aromaticivorans DSM 12444]|uniref:Putative enzyme of poly-gamma-glutamate biosynthesis (Capsule formation)-like protein n=1 Tax=Novosphingobium aromaticivorans (strain ATCC 700278 / DSM 12444 / CCUG 56034 / CIP 105152 / NBRC 16084 / F199) TaxID=279238 RepID=A4XEB0_NOVAD|nr:CapA family protein [Novosphingobium aromaticivorans]ABP64271.1 Putative enzyme of poly-gamma-glutamate biosynthesis (capsule formation)-like protein [Novosphingobium aromaticivorans DSM 12444]SCY80831.1 poly-gamma-glutamate synthesis protein (capsule biosynthesis protein) [Novosphingobium aromaticivorans]
MVHTVLATGDLAMDRDDYDACFAGTRAVLNEADIVFGQLETSFAEKGVRLPQARHAVLARPDGAGALARAGFDVISMAGNHVMDWGHEAFFETRGHIEAQGMSVVGAGANIAEARRPVIRTLPDGTRVAFLAYSSILPHSYWADERRPGCAPMRAFTVYEQIEHDQPGTPARIHTYPHREDLAAMEADIRAAKEQADVVLVSHHWGIHFVRAVIADYQRDVARAAIAAGADAIFGGHAHILKGCEMIEGKPVFYSLCNFATDLRMDPAHAASKSFNEIRVLAEEWDPDFESLYNFPKAARLSIIARLDIAGGKVLRAGFLPVTIGRDAVPRLAEPGSEDHGAVVDYLSAVTEEAGLNARYRMENDMVLVELAE